MAGWLDTLRDGGWLTLGRLRLWALAVLVASAAGSSIWSRPRTA